MASPKSKGCAEENVHVSAVVGKFDFAKMINSLPDLVLAIIFGYLPDGERICTLSTVCKKWHDIIHSSTVWKKVDFDCQRRIKSDILQNYVYLGTREIILSECCYLEWGDICSILSRCKRIDVFVAPWIGYRKNVVPDFTQTLNIACLRYLALSHCQVTDSLFIQLPLKCPLLKIFLLQDCQEITEKAYMTSHFKTHEYLKILNVASNREALSPRCVIELLKYSNGKVLLDIRGHHFTEEDFHSIAEKHPDVMARIKDVEEYRYML